MRLVILTVFMAFQSSCDNNTCNGSSAENFVSQFYKQYLRAYQLNWQEREELMEILQNENCSSSLLERLDFERYQRENTHDLLTSDFGADVESVNSLVVTQNKDLICTFDVSYQLTLTDISGKEYLDSISFMVGLVFENQELKLDTIWEETQGE